MKTISAATPKLTKAAATAATALGGAGVTQVTGSGPTAVLAASPTIATPTISGVITLTTLAAVVAPGAASTHKLPVFKIGNTTFYALLTTDPG